MAQTISPKRSAKQSSVPPGPNTSHRIGPLWAVFLPIVLLACFCLLERINSRPHLFEAFGAAVAVLVVFFFLLYWQVASSGRTLSYEFIPRPVHYIQFMMHTSVYLYWGWYWQEVYHEVSLIAAQIVFAYAIEMLVCWSRRDKWVLGFGAVPIVMSTNLFLWFKDDWFYLQFLLIATAVLGKDFIKWKREGHLTHIFNPSAFSLFIFSIALIATKSTDISWGVQIASTFDRPPHIYLEIFLLGLVVQALFRVTLVTFSAAAALYALNLWYTRMTGEYQFIDSNIPVAVFLGLHLLVTDPATSPRKDLGKILFGVMYGAGVFGAYSILNLIGAPGFYDKLLVVPLLNLTVQVLDRFSDAVAATFESLAALLRPRPRQLNYAWMAAWACLFATMTASGFLVKGKDHPGLNPEYWAHACQQGRSSACATWIKMSQGISDLEAVLRVEPNLAEAHRDLGTALSEIPNRVEEAIGHLETALRINPNDAHAHSNLGIVLMEIPGRREEAIAHFRASLRINPDSAETHMTLGKALLKDQQRLPEAISHFEKAIQTNPNSAEMHLKFGNALSDVPGQMDQVILQYEAAVGINPYFPEAQYALGLALLKIPGRTAEAISHLETGMRLRPDPEVQQLLNRLRDLRDATHREADRRGARSRP